jgi:multiple sugar transport system substrate-binding protein
MNETKIKNTSFWFGIILIAIVAAFIFFFLPLKGSFYSNSGPVELYFVDNITKAHTKIIDKFNTEYQNRIQIIPIDMPFNKFSTNERKEILARSLRSKSERLDIFSVDVIWIPRFARWAYPLDKQIDKVTLDNFNKSVLESCYYNGKLVTLPFYTNVSVLYYRKDLIQRLPDYEELERKLRSSIEWDEFVDLGFRWKKEKLPYFIFPADNYEGFICFLHETMSEKTSHEAFSQDTVNLELPMVKRSLKLIYNFINTWKLTPSDVTEFDELESLNFALENDVLFILGWPGYRLHHKNNVTHPEKLDLITEIPLPHFSDIKKYGVFGGWNLMVSKFSTKKEEAIEFIRFVEREENQILLFEQAGHFPIIESLYNDSTFLSTHPEMTYYKELLDNGRHRPVRTDYTQISDIMSYYFKMMIKNQISIDEAIQMAMQKINTNQVFIR